jgi:hypothetical protein
MNLWILVLLGFERAALQALLHPNAPLRISKLDTELTIQGRGRQMLIDGIARSEKYVYIIEVKAAEKIRNVADVVYQLNKGAEAYTVHAATNGISSDVRKIIIVSAGASMPDSFSDVPILKFDASRGEFTNVEALKRLFPDLDWR